MFIFLDLDAMATLESYLNQATAEPGVLVMMQNTNISILLYEIICFMG